MRIGGIYDFNPPGLKDAGNHVCKVEVMKIEEITFPVLIEGVATYTQEGVRYDVPKTTRTEESKSLFTCRRVDNGSPVLAWASDLKK